MDREFSKDISSYKKDVWKGFSKEELTVILMAVLIGCVVTYVAVRYFGLSFSDAVYPASMVGIPVIYVFFKKENGMPFIQVILKKRKLKKTSGKFNYKSSEMRILELESEERKRLVDEEKRIKKRRKRL